MASDLRVRRCTSCRMHGCGCRETGAGETRDIIMGNSVRAAVDYLQDPQLVRGIQERLGVKRIVTGKTLDSKSNGGPASEDRGGRRAREGTTANGSVVNGSGKNFGWLATKRRKRLRHPVSPHLSPVSSPEPEDIIVETIPALDIFFKLATELGYEPFYITVLPFLIWNVDTLMTRHMVVLWIGSMYIGQACKALLKVRRPACPPAIRLEINPSLETEYGFPSSHATVSTTIPFYAAYRAFLRYNVSQRGICSYNYISCWDYSSRFQIPLWIGGSLACLWCGSVCLSRLYLGVHTPLVS